MSYFLPQVNGKIRLDLVSSLIFFGFVFVSCWLDYSLFDFVYFYFSGGQPIRQFGLRWRSPWSATSPSGTRSAGGCCALNRGRVASSSPFTWSASRPRYRHRSNGPWSSWSTRWPTWRCWRPPTAAWVTTRSTRKFTIGSPASLSRCCRWRCSSYSIRSSSSRYARAKNYVFSWLIRPAIARSALLPTRYASPSLSLLLLLCSSFASCPPLPRSSIRYLDILYFFIIIVIVIRIVAIIVISMTDFIEREKKINKKEPCGR